MKALWLIFTRNIHEKRGICSLFSVVLVVITLLIIWVFPTIAEIRNLQQILKDLPPFIRQLIGKEMLNINTFTGFMGMRYYNTTLVWIGTIFSVLFCGSMISSDVESRRMDLILSQPIDRHQLILGRYFAFLFYLLLYLTLSFVSVRVGAWWMDLFISTSLMLKILGAFLPLQTAIGSISLMFSVMVDDSMFSTSVALGIFLFMYFLQAILALTEKLSILKTVNLFHYFDATSVVKYGTVDTGNILVLTGTAIFFLVAALVYFQVKDICV